MNFVELLCSLFIVSCVGISVTDAWANTLLNMRQIETMQAMRVTAENVSELAFAHQVIPSVFTVDQRTCTINQASEHSLGGTENLTVDKIYIGCGTESFIFWI